MTTTLPDLVLTLFAIVAGVGAFIAAIVALPKALTIIGHTIRAIFRWSVAAVSAVAVISSLPERFEKISADSEEKKKLILETKQDLAEHIEATLGGTREWYEMRDGLKTLLKGQAVVLHEVQHNGGTSIKDDVKKIREGVAGLYATAGEIGTAGREVPAE